MVVVYDSAGREVGNSRDAYRGDPLLDFQVTANQTYTIKVFDSTFLGGPSYAYRFTIGALPHVDFLSPPAALPGNRTFTIYGRNLPGGQNAGVSVHGKPLQKINASIALPTASANLAGTFLDPASASLNAVAYRAKNNLGWSNTVLAGVATAPPVNEVEPNDTPQQAQAVTLPCEVMANHTQQRDADWFTFEAKQGEAITLEVISERLGLDTDPVLMVEQIVKPAEGDEAEQTTQIAFVADSSIPNTGPEVDTYTADPVHHFIATADTTYRVLVRDRKNALQPDPRHVYRLSIRRAQPDFQLVAIPLGSATAMLMRKGDQHGIRVVAFRKDGFDGEITLTATGMPAGVTAKPATIGPQTNAATIVLNAATNAAPGSGTIRVVGTSTGTGGNLQRIARFACAINTVTQRANATQPQPTSDSRLSNGIVLSVSAIEPSPVTIQAGDGKLLETSRAGIIKIPVTRSGTFKGKLTLKPDVIPDNVDAPVLTLNNNANSGEYEIKLKNNTPTGTYSFVLEGIAEQHDYARNPEAAKAAAEKKVQVDKIAAEASAAAKAATAAQTTAKNAATAATNAEKTAMEKLAAANTALEQATAAVKTATTQLNQAKAAAAAKPQDTTLAAAATAAQKAVTDANTKSKTATVAVEAARKAATEATAQAKVATDASQEADQKALAATERSKLATELKTKTDQLATDTANAAKPAKKNFPVISTPVTLKITDAPITLTIAKPQVTVKQGAQVEMPVTIARRYGFTPAVTFSVVLPTGVTGVSAPNAQVPANQTAGKVTITAAANATVGSHAATLRASMTLNGQNVTIDQPIQLTLQEVPPSS